MKIFISLGMKDKEQEQINYEKRCIETYIKAIYNDVDITFNQPLTDTFRLTNSPAICLCASLYEMVNSDIIYIPNDFEDYNGCFIEEEMCKRYKLPYEIYDLNDICYGTIYKKNEYFEQESD